MIRKTTITTIALALSAPALMGAEGDGCNSPAFNRDPAPDMQGSWALAYDDSLDVTVDIGGAVYEQSIGLEGGIISLNHEGMPFEFNLDCTREEIVCPSEAFPATVDVVQRNETFPRRMFVQIPRQECDSPLVAPNPSECGQDTGNPDCEMVCMGDLVTRTSEHFGVINNPGDHFDVLLGAGVATNGINCGLLAVSTAQADLLTSGDPEMNTWMVDELTNGTVTTALSGGCLWVGDPNDDGTLEGIAVGATITFTTGYTATRN